MASRLVNLRHTLAWTDFRGRVPSGQGNMNAMTAVDIVFTGFGVQRTSSGGTIRDSLMVTVTLQRSRSWARPGSARTAVLLNHEQGHYNITALTARDMFIDLMQLKNQSFSNTSALQAEVNRIRGRYNPQAIHDKYDARTETDHGRNSASQRTWDGYIQRAFTTARTPAVRAPDGAMYKVRLRDVLHTASRI